MSPRIATNLLLIARNPISGTVRHPVALERALRSAIFAELALAGALRDRARAPAAAGLEPTGDRVLDAVRSAVEQRPGVSWPRWYRHVSEDRVVLTDALVESGRWEVRAAHLGRPAYDDTDPDATLELTFNTSQVAERVTGPNDADQACLAALTVACGAISGRPRPRELRRELLPLLDVIGPPADPVRHSVEVALATGAHAIRKRRRILG